VVFTPPSFAKVRCYPGHCGERCDLDQCARLVDFEFADTSTQAYRCTAHNPPRRAWENKPRSFSLPANRCSLLQELLKGRAEVPLFILVAAFMPSAGIAISRP